MDTLGVSDPRINSILKLFDLQTTFFDRAIEGMSDSDAHNRLNTKANHIAWLTGSLVQQRFELANSLGIEKHQKANDLFKDNQGIKDYETYPQLAEFKNEWQRISPLLKDALINVNNQKLDSYFEMMPGMTMTYYDLITFIIYREANCIGQIALWRRLLGYEAMKYM